MWASCLIVLLHSMNDSRQHAWFFVNEKKIMDNLRFQCQRTCVRIESAIIKLDEFYAHSDYTILNFSRSAETRLTSFHFVLEYRDMDDVTKTWKSLSYFIKEIENYISCLCYAMETFNRKNTWQLPLGIFRLKRRRSCFYHSTDTPAISYLLSS